MKYILWEEIAVWYMQLNDNNIIIIYNIMPKYIYYDGVGAKKSGKYTVKQFMKFMEQPELQEECSAYLVSLGYKPCIESRKLSNELYGLEVNLKGKGKGKARRLQRKADALTKKCMTKFLNKKTLKSRKYKCDLAKFIAFTGAVER